MNIVRILSLVALVGVLLVPPYIHAQTLSQESMDEIEQILEEAGLLDGVDFDEDLANAIYQQVLRDREDSSSGNSSDYMENIKAQFNQNSDLSDEGQEVIDSFLGSMQSGGGLSEGDASSLIDEILRSNQQYLRTFTLQMIPKMPEPSEPVVITVNDYNINSTGATINWFIDGEARPELQDERSYSITAPPLESSRTVRVELRFPDGTSSDASVTIAPLRIDLIVDADTKVPTFYAGRAVPSGQADVNITALVHGYTPTERAALSYRWSVGGRVLQGGPVKGLDRVSFTPPLRTALTAKVEVFDAAGKQIAEDSVSLPLRQPYVRFYELNPLRGLNQNALLNTHILTSTESTVRAEIFHYDASSVTAQHEIGWTLNGRSVDPGDNPYEITLQRTGTGDVNGLNFSFKNRALPLQNLRANLDIQL